MGTPAADLLTVKLLINSIILTHGAKIFPMDIKNFYLCMLMSRYEYMRLKLSDMPEDVIDNYKLLDIATSNEYTYCEIQLRACTGSLNWESLLKNSRPNGSGRQILPEQNHSWPLDTRVATNYILPCRQQLQSQIR